MTKKEPLPWYMTASLVTLALLALPNFIGLATRTKIWCWLTGECEFGGADLPSLLFGAAHVSLVLAAEFFCVFQRKMKLVSLFGGVLVLIFVLMAYSMAMGAAYAGQKPHPLDLARLVAPLLLGIAHLRWAFLSASFDTPPSLDAADFG